MESLDTTQIPEETVSRGLRNNIFMYPSKYIYIINIETLNKQKSYLYIKPDLVFTIRKINWKIFLVIIYIIFIIALSLVFL
jgi:hypothetical protein